MTPVFELPLRGCLDPHRLEIARMTTFILDCCVLASFYIPVAFIVAGILTELVRTKNEATLWLLGIWDDYSPQETGMRIAFGAAFWPLLFAWSMLGELINGIVVLFEKRHVDDEHPLALLLGQADFSAID